MKEFALIFRLKDMAGAKPTQEQIEERMNWLGSIAAQNKLVDKGMTLSVLDAKTIKANGIITDGPYTEIKEFVTGVMVVKAETIEEAIELAKSNPIFKVGGSIEVREVFKPNTYSGN